MKHKEIQFIALIIIIIFTVWIISTIETKPNQLLALPVCSVTMHVQTSVTGSL